MRKKLLIILSVILFPVITLLTTGFSTVESKIEKVESVKPVSEEVVMASLNLKKIPVPTKTVKNYKIKSGDTLSKIYSSFNNSELECLDTAKALKKANISLSSFVRAGDEISLTLDSENRIVHLEKELFEGKKVTLKKQDEGDFIAEMIEPVVLTKERMVSARIFDSFAATADVNDLPYDVVDELVDIFGSRIEFSRDIHPGDSFSVIYEDRVLEDGRKITPGEIIAASFINQNKTLVAIRKVDSKGKAHYFDENGKPMGNYFLRYPLNFTRISSVFSKSRFHPVLKTRRAHNGVDFAAPTGTPIRSVADGRVLVAGYTRANGNWIKIKHTDRYTTIYLHLSKISSGVRKGALVKRGQTIGKVGSTGLASGPHLHFSFYDYGRYVDPMKVKLPSMSSEVKALPVEQLLVMKERLEEGHKSLLLLADSSNQNLG